MDISPAALPPRSGNYNSSDEAHPLFPLYREMLNGCARLLIDAPDFRDFVYQTEHARMTEHWAQREEYPAFLAWMREAKGGARPCLPSAELPRGLSFPLNFQYWIDGGRW